MRQSARRIIDAPLLLYGIYLIVLGVFLYLLGVLTVFPRYLLGMNEALTPG